MAWPKGKPRGPRKTDTAAMMAASEAAGFPQMEPQPKRTFSSGPSRWTTKATPNWHTATPDDDETGGNRFHIPKDMIPEGMDMKWVTTRVMGQDMPERLALAEKNGWTVVHPQDGDGRFDGMFTRKGDTNPVTIDGNSVLVIRPMELSIKARERERRAAREPIATKEHALRGGQLDGVTLSPDHPSARQYNHINRTVERIAVPKDE